MNAEQIIQFGPDNRLFGLLAGTPNARTPHVLVLLNAGTMPRTGPFRLYVELARRLAAAGTLVFRLDLPGVGEAPLLSECSESEALSAALDRIVEATGCDRFVVGGICSASDIAWRLSEKDKRVAGLLLLDGVAFTGPWFWLAHWREFLGRSPAHWFAALGRRLRRGPAITGPTASDFRDWPSRQEAHAHMHVMKERKARILFVFTGSASNRFRDVRQLVDSFGPAVMRPGVELHLWPGSDHLFYLRSYREKLMATIEKWLLTPAEVHALEQSEAPAAATGDGGLHSTPARQGPRLHQTAR